MPLKCAAGVMLEIIMSHVTAIIKAPESFD